MDAGKRIATSSGSNVHTCSIQFRIPFFVCELTRKQAFGGAIAVIVGSVLMYLILSEASLLQRWKPKLKTHQSKTSASF